MSESTTTDYSKYSLDIPLVEEFIYAIFTDIDYEAIAAELSKRGIDVAGILKDTEDFVRKTSKKYGSKYRSNYGSSIPGEDQH